ncbi:hypothetical protein [Owenweeksia hongkongensis]|uniref:hypothetical protein n=1 Tax=Owenweeksia hongkongensis TaxID=253245 RepID=UPI003A9553AB
MTRNQHLEFCKVCTLRKMNFKRGLLCSLTGEMADFDPTCPTYVQDEKAVEAEFKRKMAATGDYETGDSYDFKKNQKLGTQIFFVGIGISLLSYQTADFTGFSTIAYGTIIFGAAQYMRGAEQERVFRKHQDKEKTE